jgi:hypothetical protein
MDSDMRNKNFLEVSHVSLIELYSPWVLGKQEIGTDNLVKTKEVVTNLSMAVGHLPLLLSKYRFYFSPTSHQPISIWWSLTG